MDRMAVQRVMNLFSPAQTVVPPSDVPVSHYGNLQKIGRKLKVCRLHCGIPGHTGGGDGEWGHISHWGWGWSHEA